MFQLDDEVLPKSLRMETGNHQTATGNHQTSTGNIPYMDLMGYRLVYEFQHPFFYRKALPVVPHEAVPEVSKGNLYINLVRISEVSHLDFL